MQKLNNIVNKRPGKNTEEVKEFFTNIAQEHDQQIAEINNMKNKINDITNGAKDIEELKGLKNIEEGATFSTVVKTVTSNLETAIQQLKASTEAKSQLLERINDASNRIDELNTLIDKKNKEANILAQSNIVGYDAPQTIMPTMLTEGFYTKEDMFNKPIKVMFLSPDCKKLLTGAQIGTDYNKDKFFQSRFYHFKDNEYKKISNFNDVDLSDSEVILAHQKKS